MRHELSVVVARPIDEVWAFLSDPFNLPRLGGVSLGLRQTSPGPLGLGSTLHWRAVVFGGIETALSAAITEWDPPHAFTISITGLRWAVRSASVRVASEAAADGTKIVFQWGADPRPIPQLLWWLYEPFWKRRMNVFVRNTKRLLEADRG